MATVHGICDERFSNIRKELSANLDSGADVGASVAVSVDGELIVDLWGGGADVDCTAAWNRDTITCVFSITRTMMATAVLLLADSNELDLNAPVSRYWPEFGVAGKDQIEVRYVLGHTSGLSGWTEPVELPDLYNWELSTARLAAQEPWWQPGSRSGYHALTQGYITGELVRRITGVSIGEFFQREIAARLDADFHIGIDKTHDRRVSFAIPPPTSDVEEADDPIGSVRWRTKNNPLFDPVQTMQAEWRRAEIPSTGGWGNARSVAKIHSLLACGGTVGGVRLLSERTCRKVLEEQANCVDLVLNVPVRWGLGFGLSSDYFPMGKDVCWWGGAGGSLVVVDMDNRMVFAYVMNRMNSLYPSLKNRDVRGPTLLAAAREGLKLMRCQGDPESQK